MKLYLARHAESLANVEHVIASGIPGPALSELGRQQAESLADRLENADIAAIYHSRMLRTQQTAAPLSERLGLEMVELDGLHEVQLGDLAERSDTEAYDLLDKIAEEWNLDERLEIARPGGETGADVVRRMTGHFDEIRQRHTGKDAAVLAVAHGLCLRTSAQRWADGVSMEFAFRNLLPNASVIEIDVPDDPAERPVIRDWAGLDPTTAPKDEGGVL
ncbi:histidine phosphatase family protein [Epidermidibacterium keratini]|uniref:Histidine phosphatase family protein n=1 Tax=Epidermidibacterium keratini TaxID=1891644 RepID=A0A7L4YPD0_9ACTN|nr:histidine phosphatase family protein [Epidermidibacterium keratini]QHC00753.1 histidine phosphatase family protein [Epidermidibacterium keratini]